MCGYPMRQPTARRIDASRVTCGTCGIAYAPGAETEFYGRLMSVCPNCQITNHYRRPIVPCDTRLKARQTISERKAEVGRAMETLQKRLVAGTVKPVVSPKGGIVFRDWLDSERDGVTDACAYRRIMATGSAMAKLAIQKAEQLAGRSVDRQAIAAGLHSHDGGRTWHEGH